MNTKGWGGGGVFFDVVVGRRGAVSQMDSVEQVYRKIGMPRPLQIHVPTEAEERRYAGLDYRTPLGGTYIYDDSRHVWLGSETFLEVGPAPADGVRWVYGVDPAAGKDAFFVSFTPHLVKFGSGVIRGVTDEKLAPPPPPSALWDNPTHLEEEIIGWRGWNYDTRINEDGTVEVHLASLSGDTDWGSPVQWSDHVPTQENTSGLYAIGNEARHQRNFGNYVAGQAVWGRVAMSGTVVEGEYGYRAQRMVVQDLYLNPLEIDRDHAAGLALHLTKRYQCPVSVLAPDWKLVERKLLPKGETHGEVAQGTEEG